MVVLWVIVAVVLLCLFLVHIQRRRNNIFPPIQIVYFVYLQPNSWRKIVGGQMRDLQSSGLLQKSHRPHIVMVGSKQDISDAIKLITGIIGDYKLTIDHENHFEYLGIKTLYDEAQQQDPETLFLYFHSKGMVFQHDPNHERSLDEKTNFKQMVLGWRNIINIFHDNPKIEKVCYGASPQGWCWYNFFWVRGRFLRKCKPPKIDVKDRFEYEKYIGKMCGPTSYKDCYSVMLKEQRGLESNEVTTIIERDRS
jgi:hypothetical protein